MILKSEYDNTIAFICFEHQKADIKKMKDKFHEYCRWYTSSDHANQSNLREFIQENNDSIDWKKYRQLKNRVSIPDKYLKFFQENERATNLALLYLTFNTQNLKADINPLPLDFSTRYTIGNLLNQNFIVDNAYQSKSIKFFNSGLPYKIDMIQFFLASTTKHMVIRIKLLRLFSLQFQKHQKKTHLKWLNKNNAKQCQWAVNYLRKKQNSISLQTNIKPLISEDFNIFNNYDLFTLFIDVSRLNNNEKNIFLKRAELSWNEYKSYNKKKKLSKNCKIRTNDLRRDKDIVIERKIINKLHKKAKEMNIPPRILIENLINEL